jgi:signal transduction histidine kinase
MMSEDLLSGLAMQSELLELTAPDDRKPRLQRISEMSRSAMSRMRDTVWAIDARKDKLENLMDRIREHAAETLEPKGISFAIQVEELSLEKNISSQLRQNLYLICKEAITNAAKHTNGDRMEVRFVKSGRKGLIMTIYDNGKFVQKGHKTTGLGMSNMQMRAEQIGASFEINTQNGFLIRVQL